MAVTKIYARQHVLAAVAPFTIANVGAGNEITIALPPGAQVVGVLICTTTAFNGGTTDTMTVTDGTNVFANTSDNVGTTGIETAAPVGTCYYPNGGTVTISIATVGAAATTGAGNVVIQYVDLDRQDEHYKV